MFAADLSALSKQHLSCMVFLSRVHNVVSCSLLQLWQGSRPFAAGDGLQFEIDSCDFHLTPTEVHAGIAL